jgi:proline iminopeptidase
MSRRWTVLLLGWSLLAPGTLRAAPAGKTIDGPAGKLLVDTRGSAAGRPLVVVNGGPGVAHDYLLPSPVWDQLAQSRRVVMYDQRGVGRSSPVKPGTPITLADQLSDLEAVRKSLGADQIDLLGHSYGGYLVMAYAARHPERVKHLLIVDSAAPKWSETVFLFSQVFPDLNDRMESFEFNSAMGDDRATESSLLAYISMIFYDPEKRDAYLKSVAPGLLKRHVNQAVESDAAHFDLNPEIRKFRMPTLVITGRYDMNVAPIVAWKIHHAIPNSGFVVFERSSHLPFYEEPERFKQVVEEFLTAK